MQYFLHVAGKLISVFTVIRIHYLEIYQNLGANFYALKIGNNVKIVMYYHLKRKKKMSKQNNGALTKNFFMHSRIWLLLGDGLSESIKKGKIMLNVF